MDLKNHICMFNVTANFRNCISNGFCVTDARSCKSRLATIHGPLLYMGHDIYIEMTIAAQSISSIFLRLRYLWIFPTR